MSENTLNLIKENEARWVDLRFTDTRGKEQHVTIPAKEVEDLLYTHPKVSDVAVVGLPDEKFGQCVADLLIVVKMIGEVC